MKTVNPLNHPYPHARLYNVKLTSIARLSKGDMSKLKLIENDDMRNFAISRAAEVAKQFGYRVQS